MQIPLIFYSLPICKLEKLFNASINFSALVQNHNKIIIDEDSIRISNLRPSNEKYIHPLRAVTKGLTRNSWVAISFLVDCVNERRIICM